MGSGFVPDENIFAIGAAMPGHYGPATTGVTLTETSFAGAWNVQGDARHPDFADEVHRLFDVALPIAPNTTARTQTLTALWLGPASWLLVVAGKTAPENFDARRDALNAVGGALFDVTASRVAWTVAGTNAATVLAKSCPLDFHPRAFPEGACAQSLFGHVNALVYRRAASPAFTLMVARSLARDAWLTLCRSAAPYGYDVLPTRFF
jgi:sarcosine oxidase subunit gamma